MDPSSHLLMRFLTAFLLLAAAAARVIKDTKTDGPATEGTCFYNGTWYEENAELPTRGLCLICHCFKGFTEPNAFTCSVIDCPWESYHERFPGCTPIYADRDCCPIGWECDQRLSKTSECDCEWRYLKHYEAKGCRPVYQEKHWRNGKNDGKPPDCPCPWRYDCSVPDEDVIDDKACVYKKQVYPVGSKINTTNPCESCSCVRDYFTQAPTISCLTVECPTVYSRTPLPEGCHYVYTEGTCCPVAVECPTVREDAVYDVPICEYKGKMYYEGEQIYPDEDPCLICLCTKDWKGVSSSSCRQHDCMLERDARKLRQGCIPIYHEKTCCPIDYHCEDEDFTFGQNTNKSPSFKSEDDEDEMCSFEGRYYSIGSTLDIKHPTNCVTCTCKTPPDFTCIHSSCPPPPNNDYINCKAVYKPHSCCPDYTCEQKDSRACPDPICKGTNCWLVTREEDGCSICRCKSRCLPCPEMCQPENPDNECSGCICHVNATSLINLGNSSSSASNIITDDVPTNDTAIDKCQDMKCALDEVCVRYDIVCVTQPCDLDVACSKVLFGCGQKTCPAGCQEIGSYEDGCPICHCETEDSQYELLCPNPVCGKECFMDGRDDRKCPICKCPKYSEERNCSVSKCKGYNCTLSLNSDGCVDCSCQLPCKPRECPAGCDLDLDSTEGDGLLCGCRCWNSSSAMDYIYSKEISQNCSDVSCRGYNCTVSSDENGCPTCSCKEQCVVPKCLDGCYLEDVSLVSGRCPTCICKLSRSARDNSDKHCPPPTCLGYKCSVVVGSDGCQQCHCESPCEEEPACPSHCKLEPQVPEGRCRACVCSDTTDQPTSSAVVTKESSELTTRKYPGRQPEMRDDWEADFIPLPGKEIVPSVDKVYLLGNKEVDPTNHDSYAYPVFGGEKLESGFYIDEDKLTGFNNDDDRFEDEAFLHDAGDFAEEKGFFDDFAEEKGLDEDEKCKRKTCPPGQKCVTRRLQCLRTPCPAIPVCIDVEPRCPIPSCAIGCMVMKWDDEVCPSCFCGIIRGAEGKVCPRVPCSGERCYNVIGDDGCPKCNCDSICIPPECPNGCWLETEAKDGQCPKCNCPTKRTSPIPPAPTTPKTGAVDAGFPAFPGLAHSGTTAPPPRPPATVRHPPSSTTVRTTTPTTTASTPEMYGMKYSAAPPQAPSAMNCPTPHCNGYNCSLLKGPDGCQKCVCDSPCAPCPPHCVKTKTNSEGRCPVCDCTGQTQHQQQYHQPDEDQQAYPISTSIKRCPPVECSGQRCRKVKDSSGCLTCVCDPECVTPVCDPGCEILTDVPPGQCPGCVCKVTVVQAVVQRRPCPTVSCSSLNCREIRGGDGCPKCICEPICPPPKCDPGCEVQADVAAGQCPTCVCPSQPEDEEKDEHYCPNLFCADYGCHEVPGPNGCPICACEPLCKMPICGPGCEIIVNKFLGRCPVCICRGAPADVGSSPSNSSGIPGEAAPVALPEDQEPVFTTVTVPLDQQEQEQANFDYQHQEEEEEETTTTEAPTTTPEPTTTTCPPPVCEGLRCEFVTESDGCQTCKCRYKCPKPKCVGHCYAETNAPSHRCPGCVCPSTRRRPSRPRFGRSILGFY